MISELTKDQADMMPIYVEKWLKIGLCTDMVDRREVERVINYYYQNIVKQRLVPIVIMPSPLSTWLAVCLLSRGQAESQVWEQVRGQVWGQVKGQVWGQVWEQIERQVRGQVWEQVGEQIEGQVRGQVREQIERQVREQVWRQVRGQVRRQVWEQVGEQVWEQVGGQIKDFVYPYIDGHFSSSYFAFYNFINEVLQIKYETQEKYDWYQNTSKMGLIYPLKDYCVVSDRPSIIKMRNGRLHSENSPSIEYRDGFKVYSLNGVRMKPEYVLTSADKLNIETVLEETNIDVRRELLRKIGLNRVVEKGKVLDEWDNYKLIDMSSILTGILYAPFLLMKNPSVENTFHLEGVSPECKTVEHALNFRKPKALRGIPISDDGEEWYQQGDVCVWNRNALTIQNLPIIIT